MSPCSNACNRSHRVSAAIARQTKHIGKGQISVRRRTRMGRSSFQCRPSSLSATTTSLRHSGGLKARVEATLIKSSWQNRVLLGGGTFSVWIRRVSRVCPKRRSGADTFAIFLNVVYDVAAYSPGTTPRCEARKRSRFLLQNQLKPREFTHMRLMKKCRRNADAALFRFVSLDGAIKSRRSRCGTGSCTHTPCHWRRAPGRGQRMPAPSSTAHVAAWKTWSKYQHDLQNGQLSSSCNKDVT